MSIKNSSDHIDIYNRWKKKAEVEFGFNKFWEKVNVYVDPQNCDSASWAIVGKLAYTSLIADRNEEYISSYRSFGV
tara:strand:+ start:964 stop:1191 length:228 start_codon:yes stop_codon:yes gene_type:complete